MKTIKSLLLAMAALPLCAAAEQTVVNVGTAGTLNTLISDEQKYTITDLKVTGELNGSDILFIREMAGKDLYGSTDGKLENLDMAEAKIVSGGDAYYWNGFSYYTADNEVGDYMFYESPTLKSVKLPAAATKIGKQVFASCSLLEAVEMPTALTSIGEGAFAYCSLTTVTLPATVTEIGNAAFTPMNLSLYLQGTVPPGLGMGILGYDAKVYVPRGSLADYRKTGWDVYDLYEYDYTPSGIEGVVTGKADGKVTYYTPGGRKLSKPQRGVNIVKAANGTTKKIVLK